jgi:mono/diheme cytochrome c family protein
MNDKENRIEVYLDDNSEPLAVFSPPDSFQLDTTVLEDGPHILSISATDRTKRRGVRKIPFEVRNGPGIAIDGLNENDIVEGKISVLINAYGGAYEEKWEPTTAETPKPVPTWAWVAFILVVAWSMYYGISQWKPGPPYSNTPTYATMAAAGEKREASEEHGEELYRTSCASCHQDNGQGVPGTFPPLAGDPIVTAKDPAEHIRTVLFGKKGVPVNGVNYQAQMPAWADQLSNEEVASVINHERTSWGNNAPTVTPDDVAKIRIRGK